MTLNEVMKETADAIREKTGKSELIKPIDFAEEIKGITSGGSESGGAEETYTYYKVPEGGINYLGDFTGTSLIKINIGGVMKGVSTLANSFTIGDWSQKDVEAVAVSSTSPIYKLVATMEGAKFTANSLDEYAQIGGLGEKFPYAWASWEQITEEEFYTLE